MESKHSSTRNRVAEKRAEAALSRGRNRNHTRKQRTGKKIQKKHRNSAKKKNERNRWKKNPPPPKKKNIVTTMNTQRDDPNSVSKPGNNFFFSFLENQPFFLAKSHSLLIPISTRNNTVSFCWTREKLSIRPSNKQVNSIKSQSSRMETCHNLVKLNENHYQAFSADKQPISTRTNTNQLRQPAWQ